MERERRRKTKRGFDGGGREISQVKVGGELRQENKKERKRRWDL
jgi:hypothetical protein